MASMIGLLAYWEQEHPLEQDLINEMRGEWIAQRVVTETIAQRHRNGREERINMQKHAQKLIERNKLSMSLLRKSREQQKEEECLRIEAQKTADNLREVNAELHRRIQLMYVESHKLMHICELYKELHCRLAKGVHAFYKENFEVLTLPQKTELSRLTTESLSDLQSHRLKQ